MGATLLLIAALAGIGLGHLMITISNQTQTQIKMDRITGENAIQIRAALISLQQSFQRLEAARVSTLSACAFAILNCPTFIKAFHSELKIERVLQLSIQNFWNSKKLQWSGTSPYPTFPVKVVEAGSVTQELLRVSRFTFRCPRNFIFTLRNRNLISTAQIQLQEGQFAHAWKIAWTQ